MFANTTTPASNERFGFGDYVYEYVPNWMKLPAGWQLNEVGGVAVDRDDNVYVFSRSDHPLTVFDNEGNFLREWGSDIFKRPHAVHVGHDDHVYCTDDFDHTVRKFTRDGRLVLTIGDPGVATPFMSGKPFCRCTHSALAPDGRIYVSDGYGNAKVHRYTPDGRHELSWGECGTGPGQFNIVHNVCCDVDGWVYVADRENHRIQVFDADGRFETQWHDLHRPSGLFVTPGQQCPICYVAEGGPEGPVNRRYENIGPRVSIFGHRGELLSRFGRRGDGAGYGGFIGPHGIAVDRVGSIYVAEVVLSVYGKLRKGEPLPEGLLCLQKYRRIVLA
jgi:DNA-binding beta-propeller fold protein YncE